MNSHTGSTPPLHRRFDEKKALTLIRNRYRGLRRYIGKQVASLQEDVKFCQRCRDYYDKGYKDWVILTVIFNCMYNWKARELGLNMFPSTKEEKEKLLDSKEIVRDVIYPNSWFFDQDFDTNLKVFNFTALRAYGFEMRRQDFKPEVAEKFLRVRMRHFEFDLPHIPLFGDPPGNWPRA